MKKTRLCLICILLFLSLSVFKAQTVYISETGKKYHTKNCSVAKTGKKGIDISQAVKLGYTACGICKPADRNISNKQKSNDKSAVKK